MNQLDWMFSRVRWYSSQVQLSRRLSQDELKHKVLWAKEYLLAAHRELGDMLDALPEWKPHRQEPVPRPMDLDALVEEGVDVVNYVIATLTTFGVTADQFDQVWDDKQEVLQQRRRQEVLLPLQRGWPAIMVDLDGCVADFRTGFLQRLANDMPSFRSVLQHDDPATTMHLDLEFGIEPGLYRDLKEQYEAQGLYRTLPLFPWSKALINEARGHGRLIFLTSRPVHRKRVYRDTLRWLQDELGITDETMYLQFSSRKAEWLQATGVKVLACVEDDPAQVDRLAAQGYNVLVPAHGYNEGVDHGKEERIRRVPAGKLPGALAAAVAGRG